MGLGNSKLKKKLNQTVIANSNASDFLNTKSDDDISQDKDDEEPSTPVVTWRKAKQKEEIIKIQQEAEIRDIEAIYEHSQMREQDLLNLMPDHYWTGKENKLPRYVQYRGDYPDRVVSSSNLERLKSSSLNDLVEVTSVNFSGSDNIIIDGNLSRRTDISISCPQIQMFSSLSLSKIDKTVPKKGILKNRNIYRPNSATLLDQKQQEVQISNNECNEFFPENTKPEPIIYSRYRNVKFDPSDHQIISTADIPTSPLLVIPETNIHNDGNIPFSGYFDLSPTRIPEGPSHSLRVNVDKKSFIKNNLDRRLNMRPSSMDLANRNILRDQNGFTRQYDFEKTRIVLKEKLSVRPSVTELKKKKIIKFNDFIEVQETDNYDRTVNKTWTRLTEHDKEHIRLELNQFKEKEMKIHTRSKRFTKFHDTHDD